MSKKKVPRLAYFALLPGLARNGLSRRSESRYDILAGLQQPMRATIRMIKALNDFAHDRKDTNNQSRGVES